MWKNSDVEDEGEIFWDASDCECSFIEMAAIILFLKFQDFDFHKQTEKNRQRAYLPQSQDPGPNCP